MGDSLHLHVHNSVFFSADLLVLERTVSRLELQLLKLQDNVLPRLERLENAVCFIQQHYPQLAALNICSQEGTQDVTTQPAIGYAQQSTPLQSTPLRATKQSSAGNATSNNSFHLRDCLYDASPIESYSPYPGTDAAKNPPQCTTIKRKDSTSYLSSSDIERSELSNLDTVLAKYRNLRVESKVGMLAVKLAKEALFGEKVLEKCTVGGCRGLPALPLEELNRLKQTLFQQFPNYWATPAEFEVLWEKAVESIGQ